MLPDKCDEMDEREWTWFGSESESIKIPSYKFPLISNIQNFLPKLYDHLLQRLLHDGKEITNDDWSQLIIQNNQIYCHKAVRINYTTYDNRREQDFINPRTHSDIMVLSDDHDAK